MNDLGPLGRVPSDLIGLLPYPVQVKILSGSKQLRAKILIGLLNHEVAEWKDLQRVLIHCGFLETPFTRFSREFWTLGDNNFLYKQYVITHMIFLHILERNYPPLPTHSYCDLKYIQKVTNEIKSVIKKPQQIFNEISIENPMVACVLAHLYKLDISRLVIITFEAKAFHLFQLVIREFTLDREIIKPTLLEWKRLGHTKTVEYALSLLGPYNKAFLEDELRKNSFTSISR